LLTPSPASPVLDQILAFGVVPVIRTANADLANLSVAWLKEAGFRTFEITLTIPGAVDLIADLAKDETLLIGAGTVFSSSEAKQVIASGARYVVSPCVTASVGAACQDLGVPSLMGTMTPTEVFEALRAGASAVKLFPAATVGPAHLKALRSVFPSLLFMPTGGVDANTVGDWVRAGAACVGVGGKLVDETLIRKGDKEAVIAAGQTLLAAYRAAKS